MRLIIDSEKAFQHNGLFSECKNALRITEIRLLKDFKLGLLNETRIEAEIPLNCLSLKEISRDLSSKHVVITDKKGILLANMVECDTQMLKTIKFVISHKAWLLRRTVLDNNIASASVDALNKPNRKKDGYSGLLNLVYICVVLFVTTLGSKNLFIDQQTRSMSVG